MCFFFFSARFSGLRHGMWGAGGTRAEALAYTLGFAEGEGP